MSSIPLPALDVRPPQQQPDMLGEYGKMVQLKSLLAQQQLQQQLAPGQLEEQNQKVQQEKLATQAAQQQQSQTEAINAAYHDALEPDTNGVPQINHTTLTKSLASAGHGAAIPSILKNLTDYEKSQAELQETQGKVELAGRNAMGSLGLAIQKSNYDPNLADLAMQQVLSNPNTPAQSKQQLTQMRSTVQQNPAALKQIVDSMVSQSPAAIEAEKNAAQAQEAQATAQQKELQTTAAQLASAKDQKSYAAAWGELPAKVARNFPAPEQWTPQSASMIQKVGMTPEQQVTTQQGAQRIGIESGRLAEEKRHNAAVEGALSGSGLDIAAENYAKTGQMPTGMRSAAMVSKIINRASELHPGGLDIAANRADYKANQDSLVNVTKTLDTLQAFESAAGKNLDQFINAAGKIVDTGSPWINTPIRAVSDKMLGGKDVPVYNAARNVALREIARVTNDPKLSGALTDTARAEVSNFNPANATLSQTLSVVKVLRQDMKNVEDGLSAQKGDIQKRIGGSSKQSENQKPQSNDPFAQFGGKAH